MADETFDEAMERLEQEAKRIGAHGVLASLDQIRAKVRHERDRRLFGEEPAGA